MATELGTLHLLAQHLVLALEPLRDAVGDAPSFQTFLYRLGWDVKSLPPEYTALATKVDAALTALNNLGDDPTPAQIFDALDKVGDLYRSLQTLSVAPEGVDAAEFLSEIGVRIFELLLADYLIKALPGAYSVLLALDIITIESVNETETRPGFVLRRFRWDEIPKVLDDPASIPTRVYGWGTNDLDFHRISGNLLGLFLALDWPAYIGRVDQDLAQGFREAPDDFSPSTEWQLKIPVLLDNIGGKEVEVGLALLELPPHAGKQAGLILQPLIPPEIGSSFPINDQLRLEVRAGSDVASTFGVLLRPDGIFLKFPFQEGATLPQAGFGFKLRYATENPTLLLGTPGKSRLELKGLTTSFNLNAHDGDVELELEVAPEEMKLVVAAADLDRFLGQVIRDDVTAALPLAVRWSSKTGIGFVGGAGFQTSFPINLRLGPITLQQIQLAISSSSGQSQDSALIVKTGVALGGEIGPVDFSVDNLGLRMVTRFKDGNAGPFDIALGFDPPNGLGIAIESPAVSGGGFLKLDFEKGEYAGALQLTIQDKITVTAMGMITTRLPNGASGFSFVVIITAQGFQPIPLGLGFMLTAIGGILAINRTVNEEFLREGIKNQTLNHLLFPKDPIRNAPQIFGTLNNAFPPRLGNYLFGPVVRIAWGTPALLTMDLALVLELGKRRRLIILGRVSAIMPSEKHDLLRLQMNALGVIDFDQSSISLDAVLFDSRLAGKFAITGSMAMRLNWGSSPVFALSIGGFHPAFKPPANFPVLQRLAISFSNSSDFKLWAECYIAITSNTLQFGAKLELLAKAGGFSIEGRVGFDVLIQFDPFMFLAAFYASVQLKRGSRNLFKVKVEGELSGPRPLHVKGKATFEILWCDFSVRFDRTLVQGERPPKLAPVNVTERLLAALNESQNWSGQVPENVRRLVTLRELHDAQQIVFHPLGTLGVKQSVVPLDLEISRFGNTTPAGERSFKVNSFTVTGKEVRFNKVQDFFSPSQFLELSDQEKLSAPSFERLNAGVNAGVSGFLFSTKPDDILEASIQYETLIVDEQFKPEPVKPPAPITADFFARHLSLGAAARSNLRRTGTTKYRSRVNKYSLGTTGWTIASTEDGSKQGTPDFASGTVSSYAEAFNALEKLKVTNPAKARKLMLVRTPVEPE